VGCFFLFVLLVFFCLLRGLFTILEFFSFFFTLVFFFSFFSLMDWWFLLLVFACVVLVCFFFLFGGVLCVLHTLSCDTWLFSMCGGV